MTDTKEMKRLALAVVALAGLTAGAASAAEPVPASNAEPIVVAQAAPTVARAPTAAADVAAFPSYQAGVRAAAAKGPDALRWYIQRTRGIYNFYFWDFAPRE